MYAEALCGNMLFGGAIESRNCLRRYGESFSRLAPVRKSPMKKSYLIIRLLIAQFKAMPKDDLSNHEIYIDDSELLCFDSAC
jgi:hypothetical protein